MYKGTGENIIRSFQKRIKFYDLLSGGLLALSFSVLAITLLVRFSALHISPIAVAFIGIASIAVSVYATRNISESDVARLLNRLFPQLEESCELVLKPFGSLNLLERLQAERVEQVLLHIQTPTGINKKLKSSALIFVATVIASFLVVKIPLHFNNNKIDITSSVHSNSVKEKVPPEIKSVEVSIFPPTYTRNPKRTQRQFSVTAEDGSMISWKLQTSTQVKSMKLIFNDKQEFTMHLANGTEWTFSKSIVASGFYQVSLDGKLSDFYKLEVVKDQPATIKIIAPKQYSTIGFGQPQQTKLSVSLADDYGISNAYISATVASGQGEGVKFKEQRLSFGTTFGGKQYNLNKLINLQVLGMAPGDELYFYIQASDNRGQQSRSDVYIVSIQDTAQLMSMEGMASGVSLVPEYFRSQRQIIIDTEKLLKDKDSIGVEAFNSRSNNLGIDQKMLRLRYGKFLGEEDESDAGGHDEGGGNEPAALGDASKLIDQYTHKHDQAEDATFFEPELKKQLKATLTEMWNSELRLRTYKPREALPYEYKALRLLKDLQQQSRAYVAKTSAKTTVLKLEKRLTGELDKIGSPVVRKETVKQSSQTDQLRKAVSVLEELKAGIGPERKKLQLLQNANQEILRMASQQPATYLDAVGAMRRILANSKKANAQDIAMVEKALAKIIVPAPRLPQPASAAKSSLSEYYFKNLNLK